MMSMRVHRMLIKWRTVFLSLISCDDCFFELRRGRSRRHVASGGASQQFTPQGEELGGESGTDSPEAMRD